MTHHLAPDDLADLRARLAAQEARSAAQETEIARLNRRRRLPRRALPLLLAALLVALVPLGTLAANPFTDLNPNSVHNGDIDLIYDAGITTGCDPGVAYCPNRNVTREEMASFLARTAGLGGNPPIANAKTAQTAQTAQSAVSAQTATSATNAANAVNAGNANTVGGYAPSGLVRASRATGSVTTTTNSTVVVATVAITAPGPGLAVVTAGVRADAPPNQGACPCSGTVSLGHVQKNAATPTNISVAIPSNANAAANTDSTGITYAFPVDAGPQTFEVRAFRLNGTATINFYATATVLFVPFGGTGGVGAFEGEATP